MVWTVIISAHRPANRVIHRLRGPVDKLEPRPFTGRFLVLPDRIIEPAYCSHNGQGSVPQRIKLIQSAGLVERRHEKEVCSCLDPMRQLFVITDIAANPPWVTTRQKAKRPFQILFAGAENSEPQAHPGDD